MVAEASIREEMKSDEAAHNPTEGDSSATAPHESAGSSDVRRLTSMFERRLSSSSLPLPSPPPPSLPQKQKAPADKCRHQFPPKNTDGASLSIKEGKALFERAFDAKLLGGEHISKRSEKVAAASSATSVPKLPSPPPPSSRRVVVVEELKELPPSPRPIEKKVAESTKLPSPMPPLPPNAVVEPKLLPPKNKVVVMSPRNQTARELSSPSSCSDAVIAQRRKALMQGLKLHLNATNANSPSPVEMVSSASYALTGPNQQASDQALSQIDHGESTLRIGVPNETTQDNGEEDKEKCCYVSPKPCEFEKPSEVNDGLEEGVQISITLRAPNRHGRWRLKSSREKLKSSCDYAFDRCKRCINSSTTVFAAFLGRARDRILQYFAILWVSFGQLLMYFWLNIAMLASCVLQSTCNHVNHYHTIISLAPRALATTGLSLAKMERGVAASMISMTVSIITGMYPTSPSYNVFVSMTLLFFSMKTDKDWQERSQYQSIMLIIEVMLSTCLDIDWLSYKYFPDSLVDDEALKFRLEQEASFLWIVCWYSVLSLLFIKALCLNECLKVSSHGRTIRRDVLDCVGKCFVSNQIPEDLSLAVKDKVVAISWIEIICSILNFGCFFAVELDGDALLWEYPIERLSIEGALLCKAATGFFTGLLFVSHIRLRDFIGLCGCKSICPALHGAHSIGRDRGGRIISTIMKSAKCIIFIKAIDLLVAVALWIALVAVHRQTGFDAPKNVSTSLGAVFTSQIFTSIVSPVLFGVVIWYCAFMKSANGKVRKSAMMANTPSSSKKRGRVKSKTRFALSTPKRSNRDKVLELESARELSSLYSHTDDNASSLNNNYDLQNPSDSQNLLQTRLSGASRGSELELDVVCSPQKFQNEWKGLEEGLKLQEKVLSLPTLSDCHKHFHERRFHIVGSGVVEGKAKVLIIAQRQARTHQSATNRPLSRCLVEVAIDNKSYDMKTEVRCSNRDEIRFFLSNLELTKLVGG